MKILVCEDDIIMIKAIEHKLKSEGYTIDVATDGIQASEKISNNEYDLIMTDLLMPFFGGLELVNKVRNEMKLKVPIIVLTRVGNEDTIIEAFKLGADDYVTKPFSPAVLMKRVEALLRRSGSGFVSDTDELWGLSVNKDAHEVKVYGEAVSLTLKEYSILIKLLGFVGRVYSREQLLDDVWGFDYDGDIRTVDSHVARLRTKLGDWGTKHLHTVYGVGYKIEE